MIVTFDHEFDANGNIIGRYNLDLADPVVQQMLTAIKGDPAAIAKAGYGDVSSHLDYDGMTRWEVLKAEVVRVDHAPSRKILGV